jgi:hypothetical protein
LFSWFSGIWFDLPTSPGRPTFRIFGNAQTTAAAADIQIQWPSMDLQNERISCLIGFFPEHGGLRNNSGMNHGTTQHEWHPGAAVRHGGWKDKQTVILACGKITCPWA